jgi:dihydroxyacetone kinase
LVNGIMPVLGIGAGDRVAVLLNNLGSTTNMELAIVAKQVLAILERRGIQVERTLSGTFVSSLDMAGVSISLMRVDDDRLRLLDAPTSAPAWPRSFKGRPESISARTVPFSPAQPVQVVYETETARGKQMQRVVSAACEAAIRSEPKLTELDQLVGDGDLGFNLARAGRAVLEMLNQIAFDDPGGALKALGLTMQNVLGGSSGPLYGAFLLRAGTVLSNDVPTPQSWAVALVEGCEAIAELGGASVGDRTMLDALVPLAQTFQREISRDTPVCAALTSAVEAASAGAESTAAMMPRRGRSSYLGQRALGYVDPGAAAVVILLKAIEAEITGAA